MNKYIKNLKGLHMIPFGGCSIGMSLYAYICDNQWILVDMGIGFHEGANRSILVPDPSVLVEMKRNIKAIILTHMHEDHIGAVPYLWPMLDGVPIYAMPIVCEMLKEKFSEFQISNVPMIKVSTYHDITIGPFCMKYIPVAHSTPEACALHIKTPYGNMVHSGDWRFDNDPVLGFSTNEEDFKKIGDEGVLAFVCESTNIHIANSMGDEKNTRQNVIELVKTLKGRGVAIACFASNLARLETCYYAAKESGRKLAIMGRSLKRIEKIARSCGYLKGIPPFLSEKQAATCSSEEILMVCTGSQGETNAALSKLAYGNHDTEFKLNHNDCVIFSSRAIPGNEKAIIALQGAFISRGMEVINDVNSTIHASGHATSDDIQKMYKLLRPNAVIPVHGELGNLHNHMTLAMNSGIKNSLVPHEGAVIRIKEDDFEIEESFEIETLLVDGIQLIPLKGDIQKERSDLLESGVVVVSLKLEKKKKSIKCDNISFVGIFEKSEDEERESISNDIAASLNLSCNDDRNITSNNKNIEKEVVKIVKSMLGEERGIRPTVIVHIVEI